MPCSRSIIAAALILVSVWSAPPATRAQSGDTEETGNAVKARFVEIQNIAGFSGFFNLGQGTVRIVAILSPTAETSLDAYMEIQRIMEDTPNKRLRAFIVYVPLGDQDSRERAIDLAAQFPDRRVAHIWDPQMAVGQALDPVGGLSLPLGTACYLFDTNAVVKDEPTPPAFSAAIREDTFDGAALEAVARDLLANLATKHTDMYRHRAGDGK